VRQTRALRSDPHARNGIAAGIAIAAAPGAPWPTAAPGNEGDLCYRSADNNRAGYATHARPAHVFDWNDLTFFLELARRGRLGAASKRLGVDHTTVGRRISQLEKALNTKLFDRTAQGFELTEAGQRLFGHAEVMERTAVEIQEKAGQSAALAGTVRLATMEGLASFYLAPLIKRFNTLNPSITVELVTSTQLLSLTKREADVSLSFVSPSGSRLIVRKIGRVDLRLYASPAYLERYGTPACAADLDNHVFTDYIEELVQINEVRWLHDAVPQPHVVFRSTSLVAQQNAAASGIGIVALPSFLGARDTRLRPLLVDELSIKRDLWLSTHEDFRYVARVRALVDFVKQSVEEDQGYLDGKSV
jgi:DNA-binding transcriptional LysR family regulator